MFVIDLAAGWFGLIAFKRNLMNGKSISRTKAAEKVGENRRK